MLKWSIMRTITERSRYAPHGLTAIKRCLGEGGGAQYSVGAHRPGRRIIDNLSGWMP